MVIVMEERGFRSNDENKQRINLSEHAKAVIDSDMLSFCNSGKAPTRNAFYNRIIANFKENAEASISYEEKRYREALEETLRPCTASAYSAVVDILTKDHMGKVKSRVSSFPKGKGSVPIRLNEINWDLLSDQYLVEAEYYSNNLGKYLKAMLEEYCEKRYSEREKIYYKDHFDIIEAAIEAKKQLKIVLPDRETKHIKPYRIVPDPLAMYHYLIGLDMDSLKAGNLTEPKTFSYRISRMGKVSSLSSLNGSINEADQKRLDKTISENGVQFMSDEEEEFKISLTPAGKEKYDRMLHLRPQYSGEPKKDKNGCYTYTFRCTARQIEYYFFKFGEDAYIRSPENMRQKFLSMYHAAVKKYS